MRFSVIIPVYNREDCIGNAIQSIINQSFKDFECIVIDDGSIDETGNVCLKYLESDRRIKYLYKKNGGVSSARNYGIRVSLGDYVLFLDSDDAFTTDSLKKIDEVLTSYNQNIDILCFGTQKWIPGEMFSNNVIGKKTIYKDLLPQHLDIVPPNIGFLLPSSCNKCYKRDLITNCGILFDESRRTWEDGAFVAMALSKAERIFVIQDRLYINGSATNDDHLSSIVCEDQIFSMLKNWALFYDNFHKQYDFENPYGRWFYFTICVEVLRKIHNQKDEQHFEKLINTLLNNDVFMSLATQFSPNDINELRLKTAFKKQSIKCIVKCFDERSKLNIILNNLIKRFNIKLKGIKI